MKNIEKDRLIVPKDIAFSFFIDYNDYITDYKICKEFCRKLMKINCKKMIKLMKLTIKGGIKINGNFKQFTGF